MKKMTSWMMAAILLLCGSGVLLCSCASGSGGAAADCRYVSGTLDAPIGPDAAPAAVQAAIAHAARFHNYELMSDTAHSICVEAIAEADATPTEGYGIVVHKGAASTTFANLRHTRNPQARYDGKNGILWLACSVMEGTGVQVERLYAIRFDDSNQAHIAHSVEPYDIQQQLCQRLGYAIEGEEVTFYDNGREVARATNTVTDMGGFDSEEPLWIGEQISYDLSGDVPRLVVTPGVNFTTGLVLTYDDMPDLTASLTIGEDGQAGIGNINEYKEQTSRQQ